MKYILFILAALLTSCTSDITAKVHEVGKPYKHIVRVDRGISVGDTIRVEINQHNHGDESVVVDSIITNN